MGKFANAFGPDCPDVTYVSHDYDEHLYDVGEVKLNYVCVGDDDKPALLLIPGQSESWWGYESVLALLASNFQVFAVDLRGQGRSSRTPGRYTLDNLGNDLVRFQVGRIGRPAWVSGLSSGGVLSAWLSAYAPPGSILGACYEDPPLFASELSPSTGTSIRQGVGHMFRLWSTYLGDQWKLGDWEGMVAAAATELPTWLANLVVNSISDVPPQNLKEYDPEWGRAFWEGSFAASCDHEQMLSHVQVPVLLTHHFRMIDNETGFLMGALSDLQATRVGELVRSVGQRFDYQSFPTMGHSMHGQDPQLFALTLADWSRSI